MMAKFNLFVAAVALLLNSCNNTIVSYTDAPEKVEVNLRIDGDYAQSAFKSNSSSDITAIQVHQRTDENGSLYIAYAYGMWDNTANIAIKMVQGYVYRIQVTIIEDGKSIIHNENGVFKKPFTVSGSLDKSKVTNTFNYGSMNYFISMVQGSSMVVEGDSYGSYNRPLMSRYYGEVIDLKATQAKAVNIVTKRVGFALKYEISGFTEGELIVQFDSSPPITLTPSTYQNLQTVINFKGNSLSSWSNDEYSETIAYTTTWVKKDLTQVKVNEKSGIFVRKKLYNMVIDLNNIGNSGNVIIDKEAEGFDNGGDI